MRKPHSRVRVMQTSRKVRWFLGAVFACASCLASAETHPPDKTVVREYRPGWETIPNVRGPSFDYGEVRNTKLISEAAESLEFLPVNRLVLGGTRGAFQVISPNGQVFYVDDIKKPRCALVAQYVEKNPADNFGSGFTSGFGSDLGGSSGGNLGQPNIVSNVYIEEVDFSSCN